MRRAMLVLIIVSGCAPYTQVQIDLLEQTRRGVANVEQSMDEKSQIVQAYHALQRRRLDEAFDEDVRARPALSADWVIEHRRAYAAGVDALSTAKTASDLAADADRRNLAAIDQALERAIWLQTLQLRYTSLGKEISHEQD